jgi:hypothetical protein
MREQDEVGSRSLREAEGIDVNLHTIPSNANGRAAEPRDAIEKIAQFQTPLVARAEGRCQANCRTEREKVAQIASVGAPDWQETGPNRWQGSCKSGRAHTDKET